MTERGVLHELVEGLPESELAAAARYLRYLRDLGDPPGESAVCRAVGRPAGGGGVKDRLTIKADGATCVLTPITAEQYYDYFQRSVALDEDGFLHIILQSLKVGWEEGFGLPHAYAALRILFGETSETYDDWKCSFGYHFRMEVHIPASCPTYTMSFMDYKGSPSFRFRRVIASSADRQMWGPADGLYEPREDELSRVALRHVKNWFLGYLEGYMEMVGPHYTEEFIREQHYCQWKYGFERGRFFLRPMPDSEEENGECWREWAP